MINSYQKVKLEKFFVSKMYNYNKKKY